MKYYRLEATNPWAALIPALGVALFSGYVGGVLSRGVLLRILEEKLGTWLALAISAALFGFLHFGNPDMSLRGLLIGDASGVESSILALTLCVAAAVVLLVAAHRKGHFVRPFWARTTEATNNETMGEETNP